MAKQIQIQLNQDLVNYIESLDYEVSARKDIITFVLMNNTQLPTEIFKQYQKEYTEFYVQFNQAKDEIFKNHIPDYIKSHQFNWKLDYETGILFIDIFCNCEIKELTD